MLKAPKILDFGKVLEKARETYGNSNQILVAAEECCELAKELLKYPRYHDDETAISKTREKVLDERADMAIVLNHVDAIYNFTEDEILCAMRPKIDRLNTWLNISNSMETTTKIREVESKSVCETCFYSDHWEEGFEEKCKSCVNGSNYK